MSRGENKSSGTGFLYLMGENHYLVTAWHNLSGRNFIDKTPISSRGWLPSHIRMKLPLAYFEDASNTAAWSRGFFDFESRLYAHSDEQCAIWLVDPDHRSGFDVAVIPLRAFSKPELVADQNDRDQLLEIIEHLDRQSTPKQLSFSPNPMRLFAHKASGMMNTLQIAQEVYVAGFPDSLVIAGALPIWKRGSVASEPDYPLGFRPSFLIDSAMRPGLSDAPVVGKFEDPSYDNGGKGVLMLRGNRQGFCGMYSGRIGAHLDGAQLGSRLASSGNREDNSKRHCWYAVQ